MEYTNIITTKRPENDGSENIIYASIEAEVITDWPSGIGGYNHTYSQADEVNVYSVFIKQDKLNVKEGDRLYYTDDFWDEQILKVTARDFIDFACIEPYIELNCTKM